MSSKEIHDLIQECAPPPQCSVILDILDKMNRRMDEIEAAFNKAEEANIKVLNELK